MFTDVEKHHKFVLSAVTGDFGQEMSSMYELAVLISVPHEIRLKRIQQREYRKYNERILEGGDLVDQHMEFVFVAGRSLTKIEEWADALQCPLLCIDGTMDISNNVNLILEHFHRDNSHR